MFSSDPLDPKGVPAVVANVPDETAEESDRDLQNVSKKTDTPAMTGGDDGGGHEGQRLVHSEQGLEMMFDIDYSTADATGLVPADGCFVIDDDGYAKYEC